MTGILWCTSPTRSLASVVRIVQERISPSSSRFQLSQSPVKANSHSSQEFSGGGARRKRSDGVKRGRRRDSVCNLSGRTRSEGGSKNAGRARGTQRIRGFARLRASLRGTPYGLRRPRGGRVRQRFGCCRTICREDRGAFAGGYPSCGGRGRRSLYTR